MGIADRIEATVERWRKTWGEALANFLMGVLEKGATKLFEDLEPAAQDNMRDTLSAIKDHEATPAAVRDLIDKLLAEGHPIPLFIVIPLAILLLAPMLFSLSQPLSRVFMYQ